MHDEEMIREVKRNEVEEELRRQVDYLLREELDLLKIVSLCKGFNFVLAFNQSELCNVIIWIILT